MKHISMSNICLTYTMLVALPFLAGAGEKSSYTQIEANASGTLPAFEQMDQNNDGKISRTEYRQVKSNSMTGQVSAQTEQSGTTARSSQLSSQTQSQIKQSERSNELASKSPAELIGKTLVTSKGEDVGRIQGVAVDPQTGEGIAVIDGGEFVVLGSTQVAVPFSEMEMQGDKLKLKREISGDQLVQQFPYQQDQQQNLQSSDSVAIYTRFNELDKNNDGNLSKDEAQQADNLVDNWKQVDKNKNGQLEQSEFSAFETEQRYQQQQNQGDQQ